MPTKVRDPGTLERLAHLRVDDEPRRIVENKNIGRRARAGTKSGPFANQPLCQRLGIRAGHNLVDLVERSCIVTGARSKPQAQTCSSSCSS